MVLVFIPLLMPAVGLVTPLYLLLNNFKIMDCGGGATALMPLFACDGVKGRMIFNLRDSLLGVGIALLGGFLIYGALKMFIGNRLTQEEEFNGADLSIHKISASPERESI